MQGPDVTNSNEQGVRLVRYHRYQVRFYYQKVMVINGKNEHSFSRRVDQLYQVLLALLEGLAEDSTLLLCGQVFRIGVASIIRVTTELGFGGACLVVALATAQRVHIGALENVLASKKKPIGNGRLTSKLLLKGNRGIVVDPVLHHDRFEGFVPVSTAGAVDSKRSGNAIGVLGLIVRMIPRMPILVGPEAISVRLAIRNRTCD